MLYVRKKPKGFGRGAQIEGDHEARLPLPAGRGPGDRRRQQGHFVEPSATPGGRSTDAFVVFHYGIFPQSVETLAELGVRLHGLATWRDMLAEAEASGVLSAADAKDVRGFLDDPEGWSASHGGKVVA